MNKLPLSIVTVARRGIATSAVLNGRKNFRKFQLFNKRGTRIFKEQRNAGAFPDIPIEKRGVHDTGYYDRKGAYVHVDAMVPQLIVPDLEGCELKPYVSYRAPDVTQSEFTAEDLFHEVYAAKIVRDWNTKKLSDDGQPLEPSREELLDADDAVLAARKTGSDIFNMDKKRGQEHLAKF